VLHPDPQHLLPAVQVGSNSKVDGFVLHRARVADLADDYVEEDYRPGRPRRGRSRRPALVVPSRRASEDRRTSARPTN
jgi:hypothetical protein